MTLRTVEIRISGRPPTPNSRRHFMVVAKDNRVWEEAARTAASEQIPSSFDAPIGRCAMAITFVVPDARRRDIDNLVASTKALTDGLVTWGLLKDDSTEVIQSIHFDVRYERGVTATVYRITELDPGPELGL